MNEDVGHATESHVGGGSLCVWCVCVMGGLGGDRGVCGGGVDHLYNTVLVSAI